MRKRFLGNPAVKSGKERRGGRRILVSAAVSAAVLFSLISVISYLIDKGTLPMESVSLLGKICFAAAVLLGSFLSAKQAERRKLLNAAVVGGLLLVLITCMTALRQGAINARFWVPAGITVCAVLTASALAAGSGRKGYR